MDETAVLREAPDDRMFLYELELILPRTPPLDQLADHAEPVGAVRLREFAGLLDLLVLMAIRQAQQALKNAGAFDAAIVQGTATGRLRSRLGWVDCADRATRRGGAAKRFRVRHR